MSMHNIPFRDMNMKVTLNYHKSAAMGLFPRDPRTRSKQPWKTSHQCSIVVVVVLLFYIHCKHLRSCRDSQLT